MKNLTEFYVQNLSQSVCLFTQPYLNQYQFGTRASDSYQENIHGDCLKYAQQWNCSIQTFTDGPTDCMNHEHFQCFQTPGLCCPPLFFSHFPKCLLHQQNSFLNYGCSEMKHRLKGYRNASPWTVHNCLHGQNLGGRGG